MTIAAITFLFSPVDIWRPTIVSAYLSRIAPLPVVRALTARFRPSPGIAGA